MSSKKRKPDKATIKRLMSYLGQYKFGLTVVMICIILSAVASVVSSLFLQTLIDDYISPLLLEAVADFSGLLKVILIMGVIYIVGILSALIYNRVMVVIAQGVLKKIRDEMFSHMQTLPINYFDTHNHGDVMSHYTNDTDTLRQMIAQSIPQIFSSVITVTAVFFSMLTLSVWLTLFVVIFVFITFKVIGKITEKSGVYFVKQQQALGDLNGYIEEMINGQKVVKVFCHEEKTKEVFDEKNEQLCENATAAHQFANILMPIMNNMGYILYVLIAIVGGILGISGANNVSLTGTGILTLGMIASFLQLSRSFIMPLSQVSQQLASIIMALAGAERIFKLMDEKSEIDNGYVTLVNARYSNGILTETSNRTGLWAWKHPHEDGSVTYEEVKGEVRFYDVDFGYEEDKIVLHNVTLYAEPGQKIAFVGATGAGKTTITNLINRFYDIADGKIRYDGININKIKKSDLRRSLGIVLQDVNLFTGTVMENLRYGKLDATDEECIAAAKLANADSFIRMLPEGYNTMLSGDGSGLSQGQRQLLSIARAAVADPPVMILDEATSSIDTRTEAIVQQGMDALMHGRTVFVIAHRLSTVQNSDVIMVLESGSIIERGNHEKLIAEKGKYYQLYTGAFELE
nr:ABC transporter ATP-binding protein [Clostridium polynesiense]